MRKPTRWFWAMGVLFLLWNAYGCYMYVMSISLSDAQYTEAYGEALGSVRHLYPTWAVSAYAVAVWGGLLASILFLMRWKLSANFFFISLVAAVLCFIPNFVSGPLKEAAGSTYWVMPLIVVVIGFVEIFVSRREKVKGVLR